MTDEIAQMSAPPAGMLPQPTARRPVNLRSLFLGLLGVCFVCSLTAYNDYVMNNTYLVGNFLPIGLLLFFLVVLMVVNAPLHRWAPRQAFNAGELAVALGMTLVSCTLPSSGLMRYLPTMIVGLNTTAATGGERLDTLQKLDLPQWLFPTTEGDTLRERTISPVFSYFYGRNPDIPIDATFWDRLGAVPWHAWLTPTITWGLFLLALYGALLCLMVIVRRQWAENERLAFPLATVYASLIESPRPGQALSDLLRSFGFWLAFAAVFIVHGFNAMHQYWPQVWPEVPISYDLWSILTDDPWRHIEGSVKAAALYFSVIGFTYFLQTNVAFSLWFFMLAIQVVRMQLGTFGSELTRPMQSDQTYGAVLVFALSMLWVGRHHWWLVMRQMVRPARPDEPRGRYLPYSVAGWGFVICLVGLIIWFWQAGSGFGGAVATAVLLVTFLLVVARVVAETGLIFVQINSPLNRPFVYALNDLPDALTVRASLRSHFWNYAMFRMFTNDMRESMAAYTINAYRVADLQAYDDAPRWKRAVPFTLALVLALVVGFLVSGAAMLYVEYNVAAPLQGGDQVINRYGIDDTPRAVLDVTRTFAGNGTGPSENHNRLLNFGLGAAVTAALSALRLRFVNWPLHPVGFLLVYSYPLGRIWFSVMLGWLAKLLLVKYGGASVYRKARPYFIGMIIGEAAAASTWLAVALVRNAMDLSFQSIRLLPG